MNDNIVEEIKSRLDIVDIISEHVDLKRAGQNYKGLCPFHSEKTPSFTVSPSKQMFHCFGCNKGGDVFGFVMNYENLTFQETLSMLAQKAGVTIDSSEGRQAASKKGLKETLFALYSEAASFFVQNLSKNSHVLKYVAQRGVSPETSEKFQIGYSLSQWDSLYSHLDKKGFSKDAMKVSRLISFSDKGAYDFFRERLMFPIRDTQGRIIAFGGRTLSESKSIPKYINSTDSPIFKKGDTCYGLDSAKNAIAQKGYSIIVEGYLDAIICYQHGFINTVAPLGTALTQGHIKKLKRLSNNILLVFDGDPAGISATKRTLEIAYAEGMTAKVLLLPSGEDPDSFLRKYGAEEFKKYMAAPLSVVAFMLKFGGKSRLEAVRSIMNIISLCPDSLQRDELLRETADISKVSESALREEMKNITRKAFKGNAKREPVIENRMTPPKYAEEELLLKIALSSESSALLVLDSIELTAFETQEIKNIMEKIKLTVIDKHKEFSMHTLSDMCTPEEYGIITRLSVETSLAPEHIDTTIKGCARAIALRRIEREIKLAGKDDNAKLLNSLITKKKKILSETQGGTIEKTF
jgi:DNA primase